MAQAKRGDKVRVHYTGKLDDGSVFDSSECQDACDCNSDPLEFTIGDGNIIPGFENAVAGMSPGESKTVLIPAADAYGQRMEEMIAVVDRKEIPEGVSPEVGGQMEVTLQDGQSIPVLITELTETSVTIDANHPLAGRDLTFELRLVEIV